MGDDSSQQALQDLINKTNADAQGAGAPATNAQAAAGIGAHYLAAAKSGNFAIDPDTGKANLDAINRVLDSHRGLRQEIAQVQSKTQLGETPHAGAFADWNMRVAATGPFAFVPVHEQIVVALADMAQAVQIAMDNYQKADHDSAGTFKSIDNR